MTYFLVLVFIALASTACGDDRDCAIDRDCFSGEYCSGGSCVDGERPTSNAANNANSANSANSVNSVNSIQAACVVNPAASPCEDDSFEENDIPQLNDPLAIDQKAWCDAGILVNPSQSFEAKLCSGDDIDTFRIQIDNRSPDSCLASRFTLRVTVDIDVECPAELVDIRPFTFFSSPVSTNLCDENENVRCEVENGGERHVIEWLLDEEQLVDTRLLVQSRQRDVQFGYVVTAEIIQ